MKISHIIKIVAVLFILLLLQAQTTEASLVDTELTTGNIMSAGCWSAPSVPNLIYPTNGYIANTSSAWYSNPYMDWSDSWVCPDKVVTYQYESYLDSGLTTLAYRSGSLNNSRIDAPGTPDGTYYWRVRAYDSETWSEWSTTWVITVISGKPISPAFIEIEPIIETKEEAPKRIEIPITSLEPEILVPKEESPLLTLEPEVITDLDLEIIPEAIPNPEILPEPPMQVEEEEVVVPETIPETIEEPSPETPAILVEDKKEEDVIPPADIVDNKTEDCIKPELNLEEELNENN